MKVEVREPMPRVYVVTPQGDVDMSSSPEVRRVLTPLFHKGTLHVIVDLSQVPYMDSSGIATLIEGFQQSKKAAIRFTLAGMKPTVEAAFELAHLKDVFEVVTEVGAALAEGGKS